ncbi:hypothetical protein [Companilactobacillus sp. HBUAS56257]|uniref:hypothetical protein n=1 Tax=Companilactobacillus sp. HBUAS56257 TaxID=3109360 RepID=UPI002FF1C2BC
MGLENFENYLKENDEVKCFIVDSSSKENHADIDFVQYSWNQAQNNKIEENDLFIYRRSQKASEISGQFYFFGAGRFGQIISVDADTKNVLSKIEMPYRFPEKILKDDMEGEDWEFRNRPDSWQYSFNMYGITQVSRKDFLKILDLERYLNR